MSLVSVVQHRITRLCLFHLALFFSMWFGFAPDTKLFAQNGTASGGSISGRIVDQQGAAVAGASITLRLPVAGQERATTTSADGAYRFDNVSAGSYRLSAASPGFSAETKELTLAAGEQRETEITLTPGTISEVVTVTATRNATLSTDTPVPVSVIGRPELEKKTLVTIGDLFRDLPGVSTVNEGPFQVRPRIRGLDSNRVLIMVDGERLNNTRTSTFNSGIEIGLVDVDQIESVEVARGSGSVLYGTDALGGTINILTRDVPSRTDSGFRFGGGLNGLLSSNETGRRGSAFVTLSSRLFALRVAQTLDRFDNYHSGPVPAGSGQRDGSDSATEVPNSQYHGGNTQLTGRLFLNDQQTVKLNYERRRASNIGVPTLVGAFNAFFPFSNRDKVSARYDAGNILPHLARFSASFYYQRQDRNFSNQVTVPAAPPFFPGFFQFSETITKTRTAGFDLQTNWTLGRSHVLTAGASYFRDRNRDSRVIDKLSPNFATFPPSLTRSIDHSKSVPNATFGNLSFFAQDEYQAKRWLRFVGGIRTDRFDIDSQRTPGFDVPGFFTPSQIEDLNLKGIGAGLKVNATAVSGDFGIVVKPVDVVSLTARIGRSFREPNLFERFFTDFGSASGFVVGNPNLQPESGVNVDTGVQVRTRRFAGSLAYFNNTYTNFLTSSPALDRNDLPVSIPAGPGRPPIPVFQTVNTGRTRIQGIEAEFETPLHLGNQFLSPFGNISYLHGEDLQRSIPLDFITPLKTVLGLRWQSAQRFWAQYTARIVNKQERLSPQFLASNGGAEPGFVTHDVRGGINVRRERYTIGFTLGIDNLANRFYHEQFVFAPARGRGVSAGISLRFF